MPSPSNSRLTRFGLIRHATTQWNLAKRIQGQSDLPLCDQGRSEALAWSGKLAPRAWDRLVSSPLLRARETSHLINIRLDLPFSIDMRIGEQSWGGWEGRSLAWIEDRLTTLPSGPATRGWTFCPPGGESRNRVWRRSQAALVEQSRQFPGKTILVVAHGGVLKALIYRLYRRAYLPSEKRLLRHRQLHWVFGDGHRLWPGPVNAVNLSG